MIWTHDPTDVSHESTAVPTDELASTIQGGLAYTADMEHRLGPYFARAKPRRRAMSYLRGLLSTAEWLEAGPHAYVLAVSGNEYVWLDGRQQQVKTIVAALPAQGWTRLSAGDGTKGPRWYDWRWRPLADPVDLTWRRWLLIRRSCSDPTELTAYVVFAPQGTTLAEVVQVAGTRWTVESGFETAKGEVGLDQQIRRLFWRLVLALPQTVRQILDWSHWRRWHQSLAQYYHYKRRGALPGAMAA